MSDTEEQRGDISKCSKNTFSPLYCGSNVLDAASSILKVSLYEIVIHICILSLFRWLLPV